jgi:hypothetical protein
MTENHENAENPPTLKIRLAGYNVNNEPVLEIKNFTVFHVGYTEDNTYVCVVKNLTQTQKKLLETFVAFMETM